MEYIWETIGEDVEAYFFRQAELFGPYSEVVEVKERTGGSSIVEFNSLFRFDQIFADMLLLEEQEGEWTDYFFDACTHLLMNVERLSGINQKELQIRHLMHQIKSGMHLKSIQEEYRKINRTKQYEIASYYVLQEQTGESILLYAKAVTAILETGVVYKSTLSPKELLVYLGEEMSEEKQRIWNILNYCFLPISYRVRLFEETHFALLDEEQTMTYERLELF